MTVRLAVNRQEGDRTFVLEIHPYGRNMQEVQHVRVESEECPYSGYRYFFRCPGTGKRTTALYFSGARFYSREYLNLAYRSSRLHRNRSFAADRSRDLLYRADGYEDIGRKARARQLRREAESLKRLAVFNTVARCGSRLHAKVTKARLSSMIL